MFLDTAYLRVSCVQFTLQRKSELSSISHSTDFSPILFSIVWFSTRLHKSVVQNNTTQGGGLGRGWRSACLREEMKYRIDIKNFKSKALW